MDCTCKVSSSKYIGTRNRRTTNVGKRGSIGSETIIDSGTHWGNRSRYSKVTQLQVYLLFASLRRRSQVVCYSSVCKCLKITCSTCLRDLNIFNTILNKLLSIIQTLIFMYNSCL